MTRLYAICWQDSYEPWGWAPAVDRGDDDPPQAFFWDKAVAEAALAEHIERPGPFVSRPAPPEDSVRCEIAREWSIQEYEVPHIESPDLTPDEAESVLSHMQRSLEMSAHPESDRVDLAVIEKLKRILGPARFAAGDFDF